MKREKAVRRCIEWQERLKWAEEEGDKNSSAIAARKLKSILQRSRR